MANSSTSGSSNVEKMTLNGSCHCGAVKFRVDNAVPSKATKCNCSICNAAGTITINLTEGDLKLVMPDGSAQAINYKNSRDSGNPNLAAYSFSPPEKEDHQIYHHFCSKCGIHLFLTGYHEFMGGAFSCANLRALNLKEHGKDIKDYTSPDKVEYCDGLAETWATRTGEPYTGGAW